MIIDLFGGVGGWSMGAYQMGGLDRMVAIELDGSAAETHRKAFGSTSVLETDARFVNIHRVRGGEWVEGLTISSPCQTFSRAGARSGLPQIQQLRRAVHLMGDGLSLPEAVIATDLPGADERTILILEGMRWIRELNQPGLPLTFVAMEQVPLALPVFQAYQDVLRQMGFSVWTGTVNTLDYGLAQARERAVLVASKLTVVGRPVLNVNKKAMKDVLDFTAKPADAVLRPGSWGAGRTRGRDTFDRTQPAPTLAFGKDFGGWQWVTPDGKWSEPVSLQEMALLQGFPVDYPWQGTKSSIALQISNAIPPVLARTLLQAVI